MRTIKTYSKRAPFYNAFTWAYRYSTARRNALVPVALVDKRGRDLVDRALGIGWSAASNMRGQLPQEKFLKEIVGGGCANPNKRAFER